MAAETSRPDGRATRILIVDDFKEWRLHVRSLLQKYREWHTISEASDGFEAVQTAEELQPDLILMDIGLPRLNGIEAANRILQVSPRTKIIFLTQNNDWNVLREALKDGARGYVLKANANNELGPAVAAALRGSLFTSSKMKEGDLNDKENV